MCQTVPWVKPTLFFNKIAADFRKIQNVDSGTFWTYLSLRNKEEEGDFETSYSLQVDLIFFFLHMFFGLLGIDQ